MIEVSDTVERNGVRRGSATTDALLYMPQLDALRGIGLFAVLLTHYLPGVGTLLPIGNMGLRLFFVLSGFLITRILVECRIVAESGEESSWFGLRQFYIRRFLRIFPVFYFVLFAAALLNISPARETFFWHVSYLTNVFVAVHGYYPGPLGPCWSLAVEEHFYLAWPWIIMFVPRKRLAYVVLIAVLIGPSFRLAGLLLGLPPIQFRLLVFAHLDTIGLGALLALSSYASFGCERWRALLVSIGKWVGTPALALALILYILKARDGVYVVFFDTAIGLVSVSVIAAASKGISGFVGRVLRLRPLVYTGRISYGAYLFHMFAIQFVTAGVLLVWLNLKTAAIIALGASTVSLIVWRLFRESGPAAEIIRRLRPSFRMVLAGLAVALVLFGLRRAGFLPVSPTSDLIYFVLACVTSLVMASLSWEFFEKPINNLKRHFRYHGGLEAPGSAITVRGSLGFTPEPRTSP